VGNDEVVRVVIETPKGSRNKYAFSEKERIFELSKVLPAGMDFPYDFGFVPSTRGGDRDPIDVLLMDESAFPGCLVKARLIGAIEGEKTGSRDGKKKERDDRLVAVAEKSRLYGHLKTLDDLGDSFVTELERFFVNYHGLDDNKYRVLDKCGPEAAWTLVKKAERKFGKKE
jgi:inorganic pyrophosphatase